MKYCLLHASLVSGEMSQMCLVLCWRFLRYVWQNLTFRALPHSMTASFNAFRSLGQDRLLPLASRKCKPSFALVCIWPPIEEIYVPASPKSSNLGAYWGFYYIRMFWKFPVQLRLLTIDWLATSGTSKFIPCWMSWDIRNNLRSLFSDCPQISSTFWVYPSNCSHYLWHI